MFLRSTKTYVDKTVQTQTGNEQIIEMNDYDASTVVILSP